MRYYGTTLSHTVVLTDVLARGLARYPDATALVTNDGCWTWRELDAVTDRYAANLLASGLEPGDRVASFMPNSGALFIHYLGAIKAGMVIVALNYRYTAHEVDHALTVSGARMMVYDAERAGVVMASTAAQRLEMRFVRGGDAQNAAPVEALMADTPPTPFAPRDADQPVVIFFTSGSTGPAKGVTHSYATFGAVLASTAAGQNLSHADRVMGAASCSHMGAFLLWLAAFSEGAMFMAPRVGEIEAQLEMMRAHKPTVVMMLPAALFALERDGHVRQKDFAACRMVMSGGDKVPDQLEQEFILKTGLPIDEIYGLTEIGISHSNPSSGLVKLGTVGRLMPGFMAEVRDEDGRVLPPGREGRLWVKAPSVMLYYWDQPDATAEVIDADGWFDTGDLMKADEEGYLTFCGRQKQIIIHDGSNIFPQEVEDSLLAHEAVNQVGVVGIADTVHGENVRAYVELKAGREAPAVEDLIHFAQERVGYKAPEDVVYLKAMPLNPTGKVDRVMLKRLAALSADSTVE